MSKKDDLLAEARRRGVEVTGDATIQSIEELLAAAESRAAEAATRASQFVPQRPLPQRALGRPEPGEPAIARNDAAPPAPEVLGPTTFRAARDFRFGDRVIVRTVKTVKYTQHSDDGVTLVFDDGTTDGPYEFDAQVGID